MQWRERSKPPGSVASSGSIILLSALNRSVLFGLLGVFLIIAAFQPPLQTIAFMAGFVSVIAFLWLAWSVGGYNAQVARVFIADIIALGCLLIGFATHIYAG